MTKRAVTLDEEYLIFYSEIGVALTNWAMVEFGLSTIASAFFRPSKAATITRGFFAIENFRSKLKFVDELISEQVSDHAKSSLWNALHNKTESQSILRNKLVHRMTTTVPEMPSGKRVVLLPTNALRIPPSEFVNSKGNPKLPNDSLTIGHIYELRIKLRRLSEALFAFGKHVAGSGPAPLLTLLEQPVVQPKIVDLVNRSRSTLELPLRPSAPSRRRKS